MRNCFVPRCDHQCKSQGQGKRMMFLPPRNESAYETWKAVLPKKRDFKRTDKVCERHFRKEDIITTFDHVIKGELFQMERGRPRLKADAIPCLNLNLESTNTFKEKECEDAIIMNFKKNIKEKHIHIKEDENIILSTDENEDSILNEAIEISNPHEDESNLSLSEVLSKHEELFNESFDLLYEDVFEVILPSTLWGVHRDANKRFIAFTCFDGEKESITKSLILHKNGTLKLKYDDIICEQDVQSELTHEILSEILNSYDSDASFLKDPLNSLSYYLS